MSRSKAEGLLILAVSFAVGVSLVSLGRAAGATSSVPDQGVSESTSQSGVFVAHSGSLTVAGYRPVTIESPVHGQGLESGGVESSGGTSKVAPDPSVRSIGDVLSAAGVSSADQKSFSCLASYFATEPCGRH